MKHNRLVVMLLLATFVTCVFMVPALTSSEAAGLQYDTVRLGSKGSTVSTLQTKLKTIGYYSPSVSGYFDWVTHTSVKKFQTDKGLKSDGVVGPQTWSALLAQKPVGRGGSTVALRPTLRLGNVNSHVTYLQNKLKSLGLFNFIPTGFFGQNTQTSVQTFQRVKGLAADGVVGPKTWNKLESALPVKTTPPKPEVVPKPVDPKSNKWVLGFTASDYPGDTISHKSVESYGQYINGIATFSYLIDDTGGLIGQAPKDTIALAKSKGAKPLLLFHNLFNNTFDAQRANAVLSNPTKRQTLINNLQQVIKKEGYLGVNVDIEGILPSDRKNYNEFLKELSAILKPQGLLLTVSIPPKTSDNPQNTWSGGYDYTTIGTYADKILLMTYDEHWFGGTPGPIASMPWIKQVLGYASKVMPAEKILLGVAAYGYDWSSVGTKALAYPKAMQLAQSKGVQVQWHDQYQVPYFKYTVNGVQHQVWFENEVSTRFKLKAVKEYQLGGIGIWRLGFEDPKFWRVVNEEFQR